VSARVYRDAWTHEQAMALLEGETGSSLDSRCVAALKGVLDQKATQPVPVAPPAVRDVPAVASPTRHEEPVTAPLLPSVPTVFAGSPGRIVRKP
jgi:hypothetical protein